MKRLLMPLSEYNRIYQVAHGVLQEVARPERACKFFACFGAMVLTKHYRVPAQAVAGGFALCVDHKPEIALFGQAEAGSIRTSPDSFHMWVQTETHIIDFMAPIFREAFAGLGAATIPRLMFQRHLTTEAHSLDDLTAPGAFFSLPDPDMSKFMIDEFLGMEVNRDLLMIADEWFGGRVGKQKRVMAMRDEAGKIIDLRLPSTTALGAW